MNTFTLHRSLLVMIMSLLVFGLTQPTQAQSGPVKTHSGVIRSINLKTRTLTVESPASVLTFNVPTDAQIITKDNHNNAQMDALMIGDKVEVKYTEGDNGLTAVRIATLGLE